MAVPGDAALRPGAPTVEADIVHLPVAGAADPVHIPAHPGA